MKILDAPSQFKNVRNTTSQCHRHQLRQKIHHVPQKYMMYAKQNTTYTKHQVHQTKTKYANQNTKYAKQNTKYAKQNTKYWFTLFCREINFVANLRTFWRTFYRPKKYGGVPKMTIMRYGTTRSSMLKTTKQQKWRLGGLVDPQRPKNLKIFRWQWFLRNFFFQTETFLTTW